MRPVSARGGGGEGVSSLLTYSHTSENRAYQRAPSCFPSPDEKVFLKGFDTFDAASTVAAICAAKREQRRHTQSGSDPAAKSTPSRSSTEARGSTLSGESNVISCQPSAVGVRSTTSSCGASHPDAVTPVELTLPGSSGGLAANHRAQRAGAPGGSLAVPSVIREDGNLFGRISSARARAGAQQVLAQVAGPNAERCPSSASAKHSGKGLDLMGRIKSFFSQL